MKFPILLFPFLVLFYCTNSFAGQKPTIGKTPSWVKENAIDYKSSKEIKQIEDGYLNLAFETQIRIADQTTYYRRVKRIISESGIQNASEISVGYDPAYQHVLFHSIKVIRNNSMTNNLDLSKMKIVQQEKELSRSIYNGSLTAIFFLEDIRKGDVIEYSYSVIGFNPVYEHKFSEIFDLQYSVPINSLYYKVIVPVGRTVTIKNAFSNAVATVTENSLEKSYEWKLSNIAPLKLQQDVPEWYEPYPTVFISEYKSWKEVNDWALALFKTSTGLSSSLRAKIDEIKTRCSTEDKRVLATLRFVQDDIRYLGIEMGTNSHKPNNPNIVFHQRFGDCKDKSYLLCTMLKALGIEASPVLINTKYEQEIENRLPSSDAFNHATVRVKLNGRYFWFDPTIAFQRGSINDISFPNYKVGLVLTDTTTGLTEIPLQDSGKVAAHEIFTIKDVYGPAQLEIVTTHSGSFADEIRYDVDNSGLSELQDSYLNFYKKYYDDVIVKDSLKIDDNENTGEITSHEFYTVKKLWNMDKADWKSTFHASLINSILNKVNEHDRRMPVELTFPANYTEDIEIRLPSAWNFDTGRTDISSKEFEFHSSEKAFETSIRLHYCYVALDDHVNVDHAPKYFQDYEKMIGGMAYELSKNIGGQTFNRPTANTTGNVIGIIIFVFIFVVLLVRWSRR